MNKYKNIQNFPKVFIIILNWNSVQDTIECLESLKKITYPNYEAVVVDNASSGKDVEILRERRTDWPHVIVNDKNYGYAEGSNIGIRYALARGAEYVLLLNNDTVVDPEFLTELVKVADSNPSIGIAGSKSYYYHCPDRIQHAGGKIRWWLGDIECYDDKKDIDKYNKIAERDFIYGVSFLIKKEVIEKTSLLDPFFFFTIEDYDFCASAKRAGFKIMYVPESKIWHKVGASRAKLSTETWKAIEEKRGFNVHRYYWRLFRKNCPSPFFIIPFLLKVSGAACLLRLFWQGDWQGIGRQIKTNIRRFREYVFLKYRN